MDLLLDDMDKLQECLLGKTSWFGHPRTNLFLYVVSKKKKTWLLPCYGQTNFACIPINPKQSFKSSISIVYHSFGFQIHRNIIMNVLLYRIQEILEGFTVISLPYHLSLRYVPAIEAL